MRIRLQGRGGRRPRGGLRRSARAGYRGPIPFHRSETTCSARSSADDSRSARGSSLTPSMVNKPLTSFRVLIGLRPDSARPRCGTAPSRWPRGSSGSRSSSPCIALASASSLRTLPASAGGERSHWSILARRFSTGFRIGLAADEQRPVYIDPELVDAERVTLGGSEGHHAASVRRTVPGEQVDVVDGLELRVTIEVDGVTKARSPVGGWRGQEEPVFPPTHPRPGARQARPIPAKLTAQKPVQVQRGFLSRGWPSAPSCAGTTRRKPRRAAPNTDAVWAVVAKQSRRAYLQSSTPPSRPRSWRRRSGTLMASCSVCHEEAQTRVTQLLPIDATAMIIVGRGGALGSGLGMLTSTRAGDQSLLVAPSCVRRRRGRG